MNPDLAAGDADSLLLDKAGDVVARSSEGRVEVALGPEPEPQDWITLSKPAQVIWRMCDGATTWAVIEERLERQLGLPANTLRRDVKATVTTLISSGFVTVRRLGDSALSHVDWERFAVPEASGYDTQVCVEAMGARVTRRDSLKDAVTIFDGDVIIKPWYRHTGAGVVDAALDHNNIRRAANLVRDVWPTAYHAFAKVVHGFHPVVDVRMNREDPFTGSRCHSEEEAPLVGTMWSTVNCPFMLAENFVHEMAHQKLFAIGVGKLRQSRLFRNGYAPRFKSPILTTSLRPMSALVHGIYAYAYVAELDLRLLVTQKQADLQARIRERIQQNTDRLHQGLTTILENMSVDAQGAGFMAGLEGWVKGIVDLATSDGWQDTARLSDGVLQALKTESAGTGQPSLDARALEVLEAAQLQRWEPPRLTRAGQELVPMPLEGI